jgi:dihydroorotase
MNILIQNATLVHQHHPQHLKQVWVHVQNGIIQKIDTQEFNIPQAQTIHSPNLCLSIGWLDFFAQFHDPGNEHLESIPNGLQAAAAGGFTHVAILPNTNPLIQSKTQIQYLQQHNPQSLTQILPIATLTHNTQHNQINQLHELSAAGAIAFTNGYTQPIPQNLLISTLQYLKPSHQPILQLAYNNSYNKAGIMHQGTASATYGIPAIPSLAETTEVDTNIATAQYTQYPIHLVGISLAQSIQKIKTAQQNNIPITYSISPFSIYFNHTHLKDYQSLYKVIPTLKTPADIEILKQEILEQKPAALTSMHLPQNQDGKNCELDNAQWGMATIQNTFAAFNTALNPSNYATLVHYFTHKNRTLLNQPIPTLTQGTQACITLFNPHQTQTITTQNSISKGCNNPWVGHTLTGTIVAVINNNQIIQYAL